MKTKDKIQQRPINQIISLSEIYKNNIDSSPQLYEKLNDQDYLSQLMEVQENIRYLQRFQYNDSTKVPLSFCEEVFANILFQWLFEGKFKNVNYILNSLDTTDQKFKAFQQSIEALKGYINKEFLENYNIFEEEDSGVLNKKMKGFIQSFSLLIEEFRGTMKTFVASKIYNYLKQITLEEMNQVKPDIKTQADFDALLQKFKEEDPTVLSSSIFRSSIPSVFQVDFNYLAPINGGKFYFDLKEFNSLVVGTELVSIFSVTSFKSGYIGYKYDPTQLGLNPMIIQRKKFIQTDFQWKIIDENQYFHKLMNEARQSISIEEVEQHIKTPQQSLDQSIMNISTINFKKKVESISLEQNGDDDEDQQKSSLAIMNIIEDLTKPLKKLMEIQDFVDDSQEERTIRKRVLKTTNIKDLNQVINTHALLMESDKKAEENKQETESDIKSQLEISNFDLVYNNKLEKNTRQLYNQWYNKRNDVQQQLRKSLNLTSDLTCPFCMETENQETLIVVLQCGHYFCSQCMKRIMKTELDKNNWERNKVICKFGNCQQYMKTEILCGFLEYQMVEKLILNSVKRNMPIKCYKCNTQNTNPEKFSEINCQNCNAKICTNCTEAAHQFPICDLIILSTQQILKDDLLSKKSSQQERLIIRPCPYCFNLITKTEGCEHMICDRCQQDFCFQCCAKRVPIIEHNDNAFHRLDCEIPGAQDFPSNVKFLEKCQECQLNKKPCEKPIMMMEFMQKLNLSFLIDQQLLLQK